MSENKNNLKLLDDLPALPAADAFHHKHYSNILREIVESTENRSGISIGLFGKWGEGKSTIIKHLEENPPKNTKTVVFNAWHAQGDSVRRQMLIGLVENIRSKEAEKLKNFFGLNVECNPKLEPAPSLRDILFALRKNWKLTVCFRIGIVFILLAIASFFCAYIYKEHEGVFTAIATSLFLPATIPFLVYLLGELAAKYKIRIFSGQQESESLKFQYPEQFRDEFVNHVKKFLEEKNEYKRVLLVVDDLDRCDAKTVVEALSAVRQFSCGTGLAKCPCMFIIPCDETQIINALRFDGYFPESKNTGFHDYGEELLRKFFDIIVRMDKFMPRDLVGYAEKLAKSGDISLSPEDAKEIVAVADADNPRTVKKLLNALCIAKERILRTCKCEHPLLPSPDDMPDFRSTLIALTALREMSPDFYEDVCKDIDLLSDRAKADAKKDKLATSILNLAGTINLYTAELLITCSWDKRLAGIELGPAFHRAIRDNDSPEFTDILRKAEVDDRDKLLDVFTCDSREVRTSAQLRKMLPLICAYGKIGGEHEQAAIRVMENILLSTKVKQHLTDALDAFPELNWLDNKLLAFSDDAKYVLWKHILEVFQRNPREKKEALRLLLHAPQRMPKDTSNAFIITIKTHLEGLKNDEEWQTAIMTISSVLPDDWKHEAGFAPQLVPGIVSRNWTDDVVEKDPDKWLTPRVAHFFLGSNKQTASTCLHMFFNSDEAPKNPQRLIPDLKSLRPKWVFVKHLLQTVDPEEDQKYYKHLKNWIEQQQTGKEKAFLFDVVSPILLLLSDQQIKEMSSLLCNSITKSSDNEDLIEILVRRPDNDVLVKKWDLFCKTFFQALKQHALQTSGFEKWLSHLLETMVEDRWSVSDLADELLAYKIQTQQDTQKWMPYLKKLMGKTIAATKAKIEEQLKQRSNMGLALEVAEKIIWPNLSKPEIENHARIIANSLIEVSPNEFNCFASKIESICKLSAGRLTLSFMAVALKDDYAWLLQRRQMLEFLAEHKALLTNDAIIELKRAVSKLYVRPEKQCQEIAEKVNALLEASKTT